MKASFLPILSSALLATSAMAAETTWEPNVYPENQLFPSYIVSTTMIDLPEDVRPTWGDRHLGEEQAVVGVQLEDVPKGAEITVKVKKGPFIEGGSITVKAPKAGEWLIHPKVDYDFDALAKVHQPRPLNIKFSVTMNGVSLGEKSQTVTLRSINDCLTGVDEGDDVFSDYSYLFAAYVNENHPWVDHILREALETRIVDSFDGYQSGDPATVLAQMYAIWDVMQRHGFKYSSITATASESDTVFSQHVRLFDDSIRAKQANCVDGTVLLAAIYRKIGLNPHLILIPGHMFLSVDLDEEGERIVGVETTMMGNVDEEDVESQYVPKILRKRWSARTSWNSFEGAIEVGTQELAKFASDDNDEDFQSIDVAAARKHSILPITSPEDSSNFESLKDNGDETNMQFDDEEEGSDDSSDEDSSDDDSDDSEDSGDDSDEDDNS